MTVAATKTGQGQPRSKLKLTCKHAKEKAEESSWRMMTLNLRCT